MFVPQLLAAHVSAAGYQVGTGRLVPSVAALLGLAGVVIGGLALARSGHAGTRTRAGVAVTAGLVSVIVGGVHAANAAGGPGTGNGIVGAVAAVALGLLAAAAGALALARSRRLASPGPAGAGRR